MSRFLIQLLAFMLFDSLVVSFLVAFGIVSIPAVPDMALGFIIGTDTVGLLAMLAVWRYLR